MTEPFWWKGGNEGEGGGERFGNLLYSFALFIRRDIQVRGWIGRKKKLQKPHGVPPRKVATFKNGLRIDGKEEEEGRGRSGGVGVGCVSKDGK